MQVLNGTVRRRSWLLALGALAALLALAVLTLMPARATHAGLPSTFKVSLSLAEDSDNVVPANSNINVRLTASWTDTDALVDNIDIRDVVLRVSGTHEWSTNGTHSLTLTEVPTSGVAPDPADGTGDVVRIRGIDGDTTTDPNDASTAPSPADIQGEAHGILATGCSSSYVDKVRTMRCALTTGTGAASDSTPEPTVAGADDLSIFIPAGTPDGEFTISLSGKAYARGAGTVGTSTDDHVTGGEVHHRALSDSLTVTVGTVDEVASISLRMAPDIKARTAYSTSTTDPDPNLQSESPLYNNTADDGFFSDSISAGGNTRLLLSVLSANETASAKGAISSLVINTTRGTLRILNPGVQCSNDGLACAVETPNTSLTAANSGRIAINLAYNSTDKPGTATVRVSLFSTAGKTYSATHDVTFKGAVDKIEISEPSTSLLRMASVNQVTGLLSTAPDNRDVLTLTVSAADASGNAGTVDLTSTQVRVTGPDGKLVSSGLTALMTGDTGGPEADAARNPRVRLTVTAEEDAPLKVGEYTLSVRAGKTDTQKFMVVGDAKTVMLSDPEGELTISGQLSLTATVNDADGNPVPDGTAVLWNAIKVGAADAVVVINANRVTKDGQASGNFLVVGEGTSYINATANGESDVKVITVAAAVAPEAAAPADPADGLSVRAPGFSAWVGDTGSSASELLEALDGIGQVLLWQNGQWLRYGLADGREIPGSYDFDIRSGDILWLSR